MHHIALSDESTAAKGRRRTAVAAAMACFAGAIAVAAQGLLTSGTTVVPAPAPVMQALQPDHPATGAGNVGDMIAGLAARLESEPGNAEGWRMLGWSYFNTGRYAESAAAYGKAMAIAPDELSYISAHAEALVQTAGGIVTPQALAEFDKVLLRNPNEERSRFYKALATEQAGHSAEALTLWLSLLEDAPADAGWLGDVRKHVSDLGGRTGRDVSTALATAASPGAGAVSADQQAAINAMVSQLKARLEANPEDRDGWTMLIRSLKVQGDDAGATAALSQARAALAGDPQTVAQIEDIAAGLGVGGGVPPEVRAAEAAPAPSDAEGWNVLIRTRMDEAQPALARAALHEAIRSLDGDPVAQLAVASFAREQGLSD